MGTQPEVANFDPTVYEWELVDPVQGGLGGVANIPLLNLANRTQWLKQQLLALANGQLLPPNVAPLNGPNFTGSCTAPNVAAGDDSTLIANTDFVQTANSGIATVAIAAGSTTLTQPQWGVGIITLVGTLSAAASVIFPSRHGKWIVQNLTTGAFPVTCKTAAGSGVVIPQQGSLGIYCDTNKILQQNIILTGNGEVKSADLFATGVQPGTYTLANITVGLDGRISLAGNGSPTFAQIVAGLGFTPVQQGGGALQGSDKVYIGWDGTNPRMTINATDLGKMAMFGDFSRTSSSTYIYHKSADGTIIQAGAGVNTTGADFITFPNAFPNNCVEVFAGEGSPQGWTNGQNPTVFGTQQLSTTNFALYVTHWANTTPASFAAIGGISYRYLAIGY